MVMESLLSGWLYDLERESGFLKSESGTKSKSSLMHKISLVKDKMPILVQINREND